MYASVLAANPASVAQIPLYVLIIGITASFFLFGMVFGLTRSERKGRQVLDEHARLVAAIESIPRGVAIMDDKGEIILTNYELSRILRVQPVKWTLEMLDDEFEGFFPFKESYTKVLAGKRSLSSTDVIFREIKMDVYMAPIFAEPEGIVGVLLFLWEVETERGMRKLRKAEA